MVVQLEKIPIKLLDTRSYDAMNYHGMWLLPFFFSTGDPFHHGTGHGSSNVS